MHTIVAIGCPSIRAPVNGWMEPDGADMVLGCNKTKERWYLRCDGRKWSGDMRTCVDGEGM